MDLKIITEPSVYLIGGQLIDYAELDRFRADQGRPPWRDEAPSSAEALVEVGGRLCYDSFDKMRPGGNAAYIAHILESGHGSVCEHAVWTVVVAGISRSLSHEIVRHRTGMSPSQESQRYIDCADVAFVLPPAKVKWHRAWAGRNVAGRTNGEIADALYYADWLADREADLARYARDTLRLIGDAPADLAGTERRKWARQAARDGLPNCTETKIQMTVNARSVRNILEQRGSRHADAEIRRLANAMFDVFSRAAPNLFQDYTKTRLPDGTWELTTPYEKV